MAVLTAANLSLAFGDRIILGDAALVVQDGERVGLVGRNGGGKTSLARILAGVTAPDAGRVTTRAGAEVAFLPQEPRFEGGATAREVVTSGLVAWTRARGEYDAISAALSEDPTPARLQRQAELAARLEALGGWDQDHRVERITQHLGITRIDDPVSEMSGGERRRVDLARVLVAQPDLAILDEPTNHLDVDTIEWLETFLADEYRGALLLITHDRYVLDRVVTRTLELASGDLRSYDGGWEAYLAAKAERAAHAARAEANRQNLLRRELDWLRRSPKARTTKSKSRIQRAQALIEAAPAGAPREVEGLTLDAARSGKVALELTGVRVERGDRVLVDDFSLVVRAGERIGIIGPNGAGKTSLLEVLLGQLELSAGAVRISPTTRFAYFDQERAQLDDDRTVMENVCANRVQIEIGGRPMSVHAYLSRFLFDGERQRQPVSSLSGGERARVQLARFLLEPANVLLLDEPTNDLDVATLSAVEELLVEAGVTVLFVTHDRYFLDRVAESVLAYEGNGRVVRYEGSYQALREERARREAAERASETQASSAASSSARHPGQRQRGEQKTSGLTFTEAHELEHLMPRIEAAETKVAELEAELADPDLYATRGAEVKGVQDQLASAQAHLDELLARWEYLESKRA